ncbi:hypothetical protein RIF29_02003 [Crotalaria pallida]|uniref:Large ribosomal subunit protein uL11 N-terminal domain-containing protein n=1 Tax=Crotalaria pallida TaxID=3830 RepID=A0AAN9P8E0_CROPI
MDPRPGTENGSDPPGDGRIDESSNNDTSISQLVSGLRDSFLMTDFDRVEETLVAREARLKQEIEKSKREIGSLQEKIEVERLRRVRAEIEIEKKRARELCDEVSVKEEKCMLDDDDSVGVGAENKNSRLVEEKRAAELSAECWKRKFYELNQQLLAHNSGNNDEKKITGVDVASAPLKRNEDIRLSTLKSASIPSKDGSGASGERLSGWVDTPPVWQDSPGPMWPGGSQTTPPSGIKDWPLMYWAWVTKLGVTHVASLTSSSSYHDSDIGILSTNLAAFIVRGSAGIIQIFRHNGSVCCRWRVSHNDLDVPGQVSHLIALRMVVRVRGIRETIVSSTLESTRVDLEGAWIAVLSGGASMAPASFLSKRMELTHRFWHLTYLCFVTRGNFMLCTSHISVLSPGGRLGIGMAFDIGDKDKEACKTMDKKETTSGSGNKAYNGYPSSIAVQHKNLPTRLAEPVGILKRKIPLHKFGRNINFNLLDQLDGIDSDTSSSSSDSSGSLDMDSFTLSSLARNKKMRTEADSSLRLNSTSSRRRYARVTGGKVGATSSLAPKIGLLDLSSKKIGEDIVKETAKDWKGLRVTVKLTVQNR